MKTKILMAVILCFFTSKINAELPNDCVDCRDGKHRTGPLENAIKTFDKTVKATIDEQQALEIAEAASLYLQKIKDTTNFDENLANAHIKSLKAVMSKMDLSVRIRARSQLHASGIIGRLAAKFKSGSLGKESYHMAKAVMKIDSTYKEGKTAFCGAVASFASSNIIVRKLIENSVDISIEREAKEAMALIVKEKWQNDPEVKTYYEKIKKFLD